MQTSNSSTVSAGERFVKNVFRGGGTIAGISFLPVFIGLKRISSLTPIFKYSTHLTPPEGWVKAALTFL
jgi:hypothetical protein